jgi:SAM-dependent methyltransferase
VQSYAPRPEPNDEESFVTTQRTDASSTQGTSSSHGSSVPPPAAMLNLITGYWVSRMVFVAAKLDVAEHLKDGPKSVADLARSTGTNATALFRLLRSLASVGVFAERADGRFELTPLADTLRANVPGSMKSFVLMMIENYNWDSWKELPYSVETGGVALEKALGMKAFDYLGRHPDDARIFGESMSNLSANETPAVLEAYDFKSFQKIVDVGGGHGHLVSAILAANPKLTGVLYDNPSVVENARIPKEVASRLDIEGGDFFQSVPAGADAYIMKYIVHDWDDERAKRLLSNCRKAIAKNGTLLVVDNVIPPGNGPHWGKLLDINMMVATGGLERTEKQFRDLFKSAGFTLSRIVPTKCPLSIVEGKPA